ncbi:MAG: hypothetical protein IEMM0008_0284 [bacterium]|nr:MAG: hypothetical protein IEMM0008_0284 [bacterium]
MDDNTDILVKYQDGFNHFAHKYKHFTLINGCKIHTDPRREYFDLFISSSFLMDFIILNLKEV